ncbi:MAG: hypothetical protein NVSMB2_26690 [Chloroflexota bacterium]
MGAAFGVACVGTVLASQVHDLNLRDDPAALQLGLQAFHSSILVLLLLSGFGAFFAWRVHDPGPTASASAPSSVTISNGEVAAAND